MRNSQRTCKRQTFIDRVNDNRNGPDHQSILRGKKSDGTRSCNHKVLSLCQTGAFNGMNRYGQRFNHGKMLPRYIGRYLVNQMTGMKTKLRHPAIDMHTPYGQIFTTVRSLIHAGITFTAIHTGLDDHPVAGRHFSFTPRHFKNLPGNFVTDDPWIGHQGIDSFICGDVRSADPHSVDLD